MHEQFYKRAFKFSDGRTGKTDVSLTESDSDTVRTVKKLGAWSSCEGGINLEKPNG